RQTNVLGGAFDPSPCHDGETFVTAAYSGATFHIYRVPLQRDSQVVPVEHTQCRSYSWQPQLPDTGLVYSTKKYRPRFGVDLIAAAFAVDPDYGYLGNGAQVFLTDMLGDHQISLLFGSASDDLSDFFDNLNVAVTYYNQTKRLNYGVGAFHLASYIGSIYDLIRFERRYGVIGGVSYPFSKFLRVDFQTIVKAMERDDDITSIGVEEGSTNLISNFLSATKDNIVWGIGGPLNGHRVNLAAGRSWDLNGTSYESATLHFDARLYLNLGSRVVFAQRYVTRNAWGSDLQLFYLGGAWDLRGYGYRQFAGKRMMLYSAELRFPLLDRLVVGLPLGHIDFPMFRGSLFFDAGTVAGFIYDPGWLGSIGAGVEMNLGYLPVMRVNFSKRTDFERIDPRTRVDFFIGFNF
ncbi:MAG: BamA/TamA family outer membrane protein, partial [Candidatus Krumholzibacteria bacterium]|nr:BamA/TamA family outer membrane protein [Candidatus Krumholzibacteria bacterium]